MVLNGIGSEVVSEVKFDGQLGSPGRGCRWWRRGLACTGVYETAGGAAGVRQRPRATAAANMAYAVAVNTDWW